MFIINDSGLSRRNPISFDIVLNTGMNMLALDAGIDDIQNAGLSNDKDAEQKFSTLIVEDTVRYAC
jgi:hypothetical protein